MSDTTTPVAVITGASSGIGLAAAKALATQGYRVIALGRDTERSAAAQPQIQAVASAPVAMVQADLGLMADAERAAAEIAALTDRIDVLINNAGYMASERVMTREGLEASFATNHLGPFLLTLRLLPLLRHAARDAAPGRVRIINTSSDGSEMIPTLNLDDLQNLANYSNGLAYCSSKLANVLFARALAQRLADDGIVAHAMHPGTVGSNFFAHTDQTVRDAYEHVDKLSPEEGADTLVWLATAEEPGHTSGGYFYRRAPRTPHALANDEAFIERFWQATEQLLAETGFPV